MIEILCIKRFGLKVGDELIDRMLFVLIFIIIVVVFFFLRCVCV